MEHANSNTTKQKRTRVSGPFTSTYDKQYDFRIATRNYEKQFFSMYQHRLNLLKGRVDLVAIQKWGTGDKKRDGHTIKHRKKILDIASGELCWVSGTVFCDLQGKLNILKDVEAGDDDKLPEEKKSYVDGKEEIVMLEDESGRAILHNPEFLTKNLLVTGCIVAILGVEVQAGVFEIIDIAYPEPAPQTQRTKQDTENYIAFVSGLNFDSLADSMNSELLQQFLVGELGSDAEQDLASKISHLVIAGNSIVSGKPVVDEKNHYGLKNTSTLSLENIEKFDSFIHELLPSISVTVLPGPKDPTETLIPQPPLHRSLFKTSKAYLSEKQLVSNPMWLQKGDLRILGTSGQNLDDIYKYFNEKPPIMKIMESCIQWQNIAPTAPDTLYCYPNEETDPFTLSETPHVFFSGNQTEYGFKLVEIGSGGKTNRVSLISIPSFSLTGQLVLLDTSTLTCRVVTFE